jgi:excisionase family DNA binding protein
MTEPIERHYKTEEVAAIFNVRPYTVAEWCRNNKIRAVRLDSEWRIPESAVQEYAQRRYGGKLVWVA